MRVWQRSWTQGCVHVEAVAALPAATVAGGSVATGLRAYMPRKAASFFASPALSCAASCSNSLLETGQRSTNLGHQSYRTS